MAVNSSEVSVVVQGAINKELTQDCLRRVRRYLPHAEIILSTWQGSNVEGLEYDKLLLNEDPGGADCSRDGRGINNCNRELVSTFNGIKQAERKYTLKIRTDLLLLNDKILKKRVERYQRTSQYSYLKERIVVCSVYSRYFAMRKGTDIRTPILFHPSDWIYFGLTEDLYNLFDIPLTDEPEFSQWFRNRPQQRNGYIDAHPFRLWKFSPEAYIWTAFLKKIGVADIADKLDIDEEKMKLSRHSLVNNFYMADQCQLGIKLAKYNICQPLMTKIDREGLYTNIHWQREYRKLCCRSYIVRPTACRILNFIVDLLRIKRRAR